MKIQEGESMSSTVTTPEGLGRSVNENQDTIIIEGDLKGKVIRIKATGKVAWAVAIGAIAVSVAAVLATPATGGTSNAAHLVTVPVAAGTLGTAATTAVAIAVAAGGVGALNKLRKYQIVEQSADRLVLKRK